MPWRCLAVLFTVVVVSVFIVNLGSLILLPVTSGFRRDTALPQFALSIFNTSTLSPVLACSANVLRGGHRAQFNHQSEIFLPSYVLVVC